MKLVEILARDWIEWPINHDGPLAQNAHGGIYIPGSFRVDGFDAGLCMSVKQADDWRIALVARAQWEAERSRIANMKHGANKLLSADDYEFKDGMMFHKATGYVVQMDTLTEAEKQYEQELWDKVAIACYAARCGASNDSPKDLARRAFTEADAFMAERAKRMKG